MSAATQAVGADVVERRTVRSGDVELAVFETGPHDAPPVLLVHGYPDTSEVWSAIVPRLASDHRVITYDVRGAGASSRPRDLAAYDLARLADDAAAVIDACSPGCAVHVVGHDWGAIQSWELVTTARADGRVASFSSISGPCLDHVGHWIRGAARSPRRLAAVLAQVPRSLYIGALRAPGLAERLWPRLAPRWPAVRDRFEQASCGGVAATVAADGANGAALYRQNIARRTRRPRDDAHARAPVQLLVPRRDRFVSPALAVAAARPWVDQLTVRELDAGHWAPRSAPDAVARAITEHVARVERGPRPDVARPALSNQH